MADVKWVLGGTVAESRDYMRREGLSSRDARVIGSADAVRGNNIRPGQVVRVGSWASRRDLARVEENLAAAAYTFGED